MGGVASASFTMDRSGILEIRASSDPAMTSMVLQINTTSEGVSITALAPTPINTEVVQTPEITATPSLSSNPLMDGHPGMGGWMLMAFLVAGMGVVLYFMVGRILSVNWGFRFAFVSGLGGILAYSYLAFNLPGGNDWIVSHGLSGVGGIVLIGLFIGLIVSLGWFYSTRPRKQ